MDMRPNKPPLQPAGGWRESEYRTAAYSGPRLPVRSWTGSRQPQRIRGGPM